jgi:HEAT repeat protein
MGGPARAFQSSIAATIDLDLGLPTMSRARARPDMPRWLAEGGLNSDGRAPQVASLVLRNPALLDELLRALEDKDPRVRGHAADALERVAREKSEWLGAHLPTFLRRAPRDPIPMVRWHLAMILGYLALDEDRVDRILPCLLSLLTDSSPFVRSWAISSLCLVARKHPRRQARIVRRLVSLRRDASKAVRVRSQKAALVLTGDLPVPDSWIKLRRAG